MIDLRKGDCLELMKTIETGSIDAIITDPPYGTTACKWDSVIDFKLMWEQLNRIIKPNGAIVLFGSQPFTSALIMSNPKGFKYEWIWQKTKGSNFQTLKHQPWKMHENILVFNAKGVYNPQKYTVSEDKIDKRKNVNNPLTNKDGVYGKLNRTRKKDDGTRYPNSIQTIKNPNNSSLHPTQKPIALMEYLIKTYTNENETVLDFTMGSGSTGVAAKNLNRNFIGIEMDDKYFDIATERINKLKQ
jgi:site-specific DNA-methyltransferase (adenine-specific)|tara:strand:- start:30 stop:761 length:732 start_codon:yes stop_codon:yes gene_type:complete